MGVSDGLGVCWAELEAIVRAAPALGPIVSCASARPTRKDARQVLGLDRVKDEANVLKHCYLYHRSNLQYKYR